MMNLAKVIKRQSTPWILDNGDTVNPPVGTTVQYEELPRGKRGDYWRRVYFPGYASRMKISMIAFNRYFGEL